MSIGCHDRFSEGISFVPAQFNSRHASLNLLHWQLAFPLLTITACAMPLFNRSWHTSTGAARVLLVVNVPEATQGTSEARIARSGIVPADLMPQAVVPARKP